MPLEDSLGPAAAFNAPRLRLGPSSSPFVAGPLSAALGLETGETGGPQELDLTGELEGVQETVPLSMVVVPVESAPGGDLYPEADYALRSVIAEGDDNYIFMDETPTGTLVLGAVGGDLLDPILQGMSQLSFGEIPDYFPLVFGNKLALIELPMDVDLGDGISMSGTVPMDGEIDAWGTVTVPAGRYEALRQHTFGVAELIVDTGEGGTLTFVQEIDQYQWLAPRVGLVSLIQQIRLTPPEGLGIPETVISQVMRLSRFAPAPTAVGTATLGAIKGSFRR